MASVTFPTNVGGDGSTVSDDANATTGLANGGHRTRFVPALGQIVGIAQNLVNSASSASASAALALNAPGTQATSASAISIGIGSKSLTLAQTGKNFVVGQYVALVTLSSEQTLYLSFFETNYGVFDPNSPTGPDWMVGVITAFNSGTGAMTVNVSHYAGAGLATSWSVVPTSPLMPYVPLNYGPLI